jgi:DNA-binding transcriptional ArsR family regulator
MDESMLDRSSRTALRGPELLAVAATFRTLSDPTRLRILSLLGESECCVHELCAGLGMSQPAVSHQLRLLRVAHLVRARRVGREVFYALDDDHVMELVAQARSHAGHARPATAARRPAHNARSARSTRSSEGRRPAQGGRHGA